MLVFRGYSFLQWTTFFIMYCILGWIFESVYCSLKSGKLKNRGFCHGPWIPLYGFGATLLVLIAEPWRDSPWMVYLAGVLGGTALELLTGLLMNWIFHTRWWDYSGNPFHFRGYICLYSSLFWGVMALLVMYGAQPHVLDISKNWSYSIFLVVDTMLYTLFIEDVIGSVMAALEIRDRITRLARNSGEIQRLSQYLSDITESLGQARLEMAENAEQLREIRAQEGNAAAARAIVAGTVAAVTSATVTVAKDTVIAAKGTMHAAKDTISAAKDNAIAASETLSTKAKSNLLGMKDGLLSWNEERRALLQKEKEETERRLLLLRDGGDEKTGHMSWWIKTMLRNNPDAISREKSFDDLKLAAQRKGRRGKD